MTIITMPSSPPPQTARFGQRSNTQTFPSPLSGSAQSLELPGAVWMLQAKMPPMQSAVDRALWRSFFTKVRGRANRFYAGDPLHRVARGLATGSPQVAGAGQTGASLMTDGWTPSITGILKEGDYVAFTGGTRRELHMLAADANSDGGGSATLVLEPPIRSAPPDNEPLIVTAATCIMMMVDTELGWDEAEAAIAGFAFNAVEAPFG